ncbi:MAG: peptide ABC transporter substrate-binding protein [Spongiibacteraceae bacterium]
MWRNLESARYFVATITVVISLAAWVERTCAETAVDFDRQRITITLANEPPNLNSMETMDQTSGFVLAHVMEGLLQYDARGELAAGVAERWELRADGATFWLRRNARWSDGKPVTAHDFVFAWRRIVTPATASHYAGILFPIKNAQRISRGELPPTAMGVHATDDFRLDVEFERPCPYFLGLTAYFIYDPVREDFFNSRGPRYAAEAGDMIYNGAFTISRWVHGARMTLQKNPHYWNRAQVHLQQIDIPYFAIDPVSAYNLFKNENIALTILETEGLDDALARGYPMTRHRTGAMFYFEFNQRAGRATANRALRKAIQALLDPESMASRVVGVPGLLATESMFPHYLRGVQRTFREEYPPPVPVRSVPAARAWLAQAQIEMGAPLPTLILLTREDPRAAREAEYLQQLLQKGLGLQLRIERQNTKQRYAKMARGEFDIVLTGWGPDYDDPMTFGDVFASWNENNRGQYRNPAYDRWVEIANATADQAQRMHAFAQMQQLLIDDAPILPTYENSKVYVQHPRLQGVAHSVFGVDPDLRYARVLPERSLQNATR